MIQMGYYRIRHPLLLLLRPKLVLYKSPKKGKIKGKLKLFRLNRSLKTVQVGESQFIFALKVDIITLELVLKFYSETAFEGFLDTPIGHIRFLGKKVRNL